MLELTSVQNKEDCALPTEEKEVSAIEQKAIISNRRVNKKLMVSFGL